MIINNLANIREASELKQEDMAKILGVSQSNYSRWETNKEFIPLKKLNILCNHFKVSMDYVFNFNRINTWNKKLKTDNYLIGNRIKEFRKKNNLTQKDLANFLNTSQSTVSAYESGKTILLTSFAYQICSYYKISLDWLCGN